MQDWFAATIVVRGHGLGNKSEVEDHQRVSWGRTVSRHPTRTLIPCSTLHGPQELDSWGFIFISSWVLSNMDRFHRFILGILSELGIEIQGDAECTITNCNVARGVMLCQILNHDGTIDAPSVDIYGGSRAWLRYYTLAADGKTVVKGHPFKGRVDLDGRTQVVTES